MESVVASSASLDLSKISVRDLNQFLHHDLAKSGAKHVDEVRTLLADAGIDDVHPEDFRRYGSARKLYNFSIDNASAY